MKNKTLYDDVGDMSVAAELFADSNSEHVKENIKFLRKLRGLTQEQLSDKMGVTQSAISQFERSGKLQFSTQVRLCKELDVEFALLYLSALHDESSPFHEIVEHAVKSFPAERQADEIFNAIEQRGRSEQYNDIEQRNSIKPDKLSSVCMSIFNSLNDKGKQEAVKRINELAQLDQYKKED